MYQGVPLKPDVRRCCVFVVFDSCENIDYGMRLAGDQMLTRIYRSVSMRGGLRDYRSNSCRSGIQLDMLRAKSLTY